MSNVQSTSDALLRAYLSDYVTLPYDAGTTGETLRRVQVTLITAPDDGPDADGWHRLGAEITPTDALDMLRNPQVVARVRLADESGRVERVWEGSRDAAVIPLSDLRYVLHVEAIGQLASQHGVTI